MTIFHDYIDSPHKIICGNGTTWEVGNKLLDEGEISHFRAVRTGDGHFLGYLAYQNKKVLAMIFLSGALVLGGQRDV